MTAASETPATDPTTGAGGATVVAVGSEEKKKEAGGRGSDAGTSGGEDETVVVKANVSSGRGSGDSSSLLQPQGATMSFNNVSMSSHINGGAGGSDDPKNRDMLAAAVVAQTAQVMEEEEATPTTSFASTFLQQQKQGSVLPPLAGATDTLLDEQRRRDTLQPHVNGDTSRGMKDISGLVDENMSHANNNDDHNNGSIHDVNDKDKDMVADNSNDNNNNVNGVNTMNNGDDTKTVMMKGHTFPVQLQQGEDAIQAIGAVVQAGSGAVAVEAAPIENGNGNVAAAAIPQVMGAQHQQSLPDVQGASQGGGAQDDQLRVQSLGDVTPNLRVNTGTGVIVNGIHGAEERSMNIDNGGASVSTATVAAAAVLPNGMTFTTAPPSSSNLQNSNPIMMAPAAAAAALAPGTSGLDGHERESLIAPSDNNNNSININGNDNNKDSNRNSSKEEKVMKEWDWSTHFSDSRRFWSSRSIWEEAECKRIEGKRVLIDRSGMMYNEGDIGPETKKQKLGVNGEAGSTSTSSSVIYGGWNSWFGRTSNKDLSLVKYFQKQQSQCTRVNDKKSVQKRESLESVQAMMKARALLYDSEISRIKAKNWREQWSPIGDLSVAVNTNTINNSHINLMAKPQSIGGSSAAMGGTQNKYGDTLHDKAHTYAACNRIREDDVYYSLELTANDVEELKEKGIFEEKYVSAVEAREAELSIKPKSNRGARELSGLLNDITKTTSAPKNRGTGYANNGSRELEILTQGKMGQILQVLKDQKEASEPFLKKVSKSQKFAPGYYDMIKEPMDLGTMTKKLKAGKYRSKALFVYDLKLIFSNCRLYNKPHTLYVQYANQLEEIADKSLSALQEFDIDKDLNKASAADDVTATAGPSKGIDNGKNDTRLMTEGGKSNAGTLDGALLTKDRKVSTDQRPLTTDGTHEHSRDESENVSGVAHVNNQTQYDVDDDDFMNDDVYILCDLIVSPAAAAAAAAAEHDGDDDIMQDSESDDLDHEAQDKDKTQQQSVPVVSLKLEIKAKQSYSGFEYERRWRERTLDSRMEQVATRMVVNAKPFPEQTAFMRTAEGMGSFTEAASISASERDTTANNVGDTGRFCFYPESSFLANAVPSCPPILPSSQWLPKAAQGVQASRPAIERSGCRELLDRCLRQSFRKAGIDAMPTSAMSSMIEILEKRIQQYGSLIQQAEERDNELTPQGRGQVVLLASQNFGEAKPSPASLKTYVASIRRKEKALLASANGKGSNGSSTPRGSKARASVANNNNNNNSNSNSNNGNNGNNGNNTNNSNYNNNITNNSNTNSSNNNTSGGRTNLNAAIKTAAVVPVKGSGSSSPFAGENGINLIQTPPSPAAVVNDASFHVRVNTDNGNINNLKRKLMDPGAQNDGLPPLKKTVV